MAKTRMTWFGLGTGILEALFLILAGLFAIAGETQSATLNVVWAIWCRIARNSEF